MARNSWVPLVAALLALALAPGALAQKTYRQRSLAATGTTRTVDDDKQQCPAAGYTNIRDAVEAAHAGDTIVVCAGTYAEGPGTVGSTGLTITRNLTIRGAGA